MWPGSGPPAHRGETAVKCALCNSPALLLLAIGLVFPLVWGVRCGGTDAADSSWIKEIEEGKRELVHCARYRVSWGALPDSVDAEEATAPLRQAIAAHPGLLNRLAVECYPDGEGDIPSLSFDYLVTGMNREDRMFVVKYFARIEHPAVLAGYSCIVVADRAGKVTALCIEALPLE
jgi:hypothetical protein